MDFSLTEEQRAFVEAIRDFCRRECGTQEQRAELTDGYEHLHNQGIYSQMAELGWLGSAIPEAYGGSGGGYLEACLFMEETSRGMAPIGGYGTTLIVAGAYERFGVPACELSVGDVTNKRIVTLAAIRRVRAAVSSYLPEVTHLPLPEEAIDLVLIHHALDFSQSPHRLLRESVKVLIPRGYVIIIGFNPRSWFGVARFFGRIFGRNVHWRHQSLHLGRLHDWLELLDLEPVAIKQGFYRPPFQGPGVLKHLQWLERWGKRLRLPWGGFYLVVARKDVVAMTPLRPAWTDHKVAPGLGVTKIRGRVTPTRSRRRRPPWPGAPYRRRQRPPHPPTNHLVCGPRATG
jgi:SAM-dependent methyltransferase